MSDLENTAPRIKSDFKPQHADLVEAQKRKRLRKERRIKRIVTVILGYIVMAWMVYLILVTAKTSTKVYDPYDVLGVSRVCFFFLRPPAHLLGTDLRKSDYSQPCLN